MTRLHADDPAAPHRDADRTLLTYEGTAIRRRGEMLNLTDMWRAAGGPANRRPTFWFLMEETKRFRDHARTRWSHRADPRAEAPGDEAPGDEMPGDTEPNVILGNIWDAEADGLVATARGHKGGTWAHWQLALAYAKYLSPAFHAWCNDVVRNAMQRFGGPPDRRDPLTRYLERQFDQLHRRVDTLDRHAADTMLLVGSAQDLLLDKRRPFAESGKAVLTGVVANPPYEGQCPSCGAAAVLTPDRKVVAGAEFDHFLHRGLNRPEHGWLICAVCHHELSHGGYLARFLRMPEFRRHQDVVHETVRAGKTWRALATPPRATRP